MKLEAFKLFSSPEAPYLGSLVAAKIIALAAIYCIGGATVPRPRVWELETLKIRDFR